MNYASRLFALLFATTLIASILSPVEAQDAPFVTVWNTENSGATEDDQIEIPGEGTDYTVEWEEVGNTSNSGSETVVFGDTTLTFPNPGTYRVRIGSGLTRVHFGAGLDPNKIELVTQWGNIQWSTMEGAFYGASNLDLSTSDTPDLSDVENMDNMFRDAVSLDASESNIGDWDVSNVTSMSGMFQGVVNFNQDIGDWDTGNVTDMSSMFANAFLEGQTSFDQDISSWNVSNVETMAGMFSGAGEFNQDISPWDVSGVTTMAEMFAGAGKFNQDISSWDVSSVETMRDMFAGAGSFNQDLGRWDVSNVGDMASMFDETNLSTTNYDRTLLGWAPQDLQEFAGLGATYVDYCNSGPIRTYLEEEDGFGWNVVDGFRQSGCPTSLEASQIRQVESSGTFAFDSLSAVVTFPTVIGDGPVLGALYSGEPRNVEGISQKNVSQYRLVIAGAAVNFSGDAELEFAASEFGGIDQPENVTVYSRPKPGVGAFDSLATNLDDNGTPGDTSDDTLSVTTNGPGAPANGFGEFVFASDSNELPVELAGFEGTAVGKNVQLTWKAASEQNNAGFEVQREAEQSGWQQVGYVESKADGGTTTETQSYQYVAEDLSVGTHQFRLKQVDLDGSSQVHGPISVEIRMQEAIRLTAPAPNPVSSTATLSFAVKEEAQAIVAVYDMLGRKAATLFEGTPTAGESNRLQFDASSLPSGSYIIRLQADGQTESQRMTIVR
jgi:surface protein